MLFGSMQVELLPIEEQASVVELTKGWTEHYEYLRSVIDAVREATGRFPVVSGLAGAGCIGKSTFSAGFAQYINQQRPGQQRPGQHRCTVVNLDGYMLPRSRAGKLTGYNPQRFELAQARDDLLGLIRDNKPFTLRVYNRRTHQRDTQLEILPAEIILVEGGLALGDELGDLLDVKIFLEADRQTQYFLRRRREQEEFGYPDQQVEKRFTRYYEDYLRFILPTRAQADIILHIDADFRIVLVQGWR